LSVHLQRPGIERVVLTAPGKQMKNIVFGVNDSDIDSQDQILSAASCTTNAITPILSVLENKYGVESGHVETVHAYTNDQNLIDNVHKGDRRGRAAAMNMVITETGAAKAVSKAIPALEGKLSGSAIRVPVINVSIAVLSLNLKAETSVEEINALLKDASASAELTGQIAYSDAADAVSSDFIGCENAGILDSQSTKVRGKQATLYVWYDNEYGYSCQVVRLMERLSQVGLQVKQEEQNQAA
jgi:glyceraldehyde 3-phosphate dehydrogenase